MNFELILFSASSDTVAITWELARQTITTQYNLARLGIAIMTAIFGCVSLLVLILQWRGYKQFQSQMEKIHQELEKIEKDEKELQQKIFYVEGIIPAIEGAMNTRISMALQCSGLWRASILLSIYAITAYEKTIGTAGLIKDEIQTISECVDKLPVNENLTWLIEELIKLKTKNNSNLIELINKVKKLNDVRS